MLEILIIRNLLLLDNYVKYRHHIDLKDDKELINIYNVLDEMIERFERDLTIEEFSLLVLQRYPEYDTILATLKEEEIQDDVLAEAVKTLVKRAQAHSLALDAIAVSEGKKEFEVLTDALAGYETVEQVEEIEYVTDDLEELWNDTRHTAGLRWRLKTLNRMLGSLRKGDFGFIFARPETGKTTFLASEVTFFASQTEGTILWFNNEEGGKKVKIRIYQAATGLTLTQLYANRPKHSAEYMKVTKGNIRLIDDAGMSKRQVERICKEVNPALVIFDQIDKIKGFTNDREDLRLGGIYIWARELAKKYCPVIGVCQSDVTGENKRWLTMDNVANAKTSKQAEADWILGIGAVHDQGLEYVRFLHASKNKLSGDEDSEPHLRHGKMEVQILPDIARYGDM